MWTVSLLGTLRTLFGVCKQNSHDPKVDREGEWAGVTMAQKPSGSLLLVHTSIHSSTCSFIHPFLHLPIYLSVHLAFISHSTIHHLSVLHPPVYPFTHLSACPSIHRPSTDQPTHPPNLLIHTYILLSLPPCPRKTAPMEYYKAWAWPPRCRREVYSSWKEFTTNTP